jgi:hypothetical protein
VLYADIDYDSMIGAMRWLQQRRGVQVERIALPVVPRACADPAGLRGRVRAAATPEAGAADPGQPSPWAGAAGGRDRRACTRTRYRRDRRCGPRFGQIDYAVPQLKADFVGINLHKWIGAPVGVGAMYVRRGRVADLDPYMGETDDGRVGSRVHTGTVNFAAYLALPEAIALHQRMRTTSRRACVTCASAGRCRRGRWRTSKCCLRRIRRWRVHWPASACARTSVADNIALQKRLLDEHRVFTTHRDGLDSGRLRAGDAVGVHPPQQMDALVKALSALA